ncbi:lysophospholipid acyltransferase family protein [Alteromonas sp. 5E99-2]|uniref:lysophospholipid acyltransferase family protein n=1 Tax=Alteromonas sp. 5E99-2 TaxID=2817683 RepID=UPI001A993A6E|nr:GNAT family N-acyltransferase [Alteromonas sp. 5E99-2]MBO1255778.1 lysophospholipid acyltransferase family protein [Alteromonas sp. 5E99-2]
MTISTEPFLSSPQSPLMRRIVAGTLDRLLGIKKMDAMFKDFGLDQTSGDDFLAKSMEKMNLDLSGIEELKASIPKTGPVIIAANHPFGGLEGVVMLYAITQVRPDVKVLVNAALSLIPQMQDWSIFTNPLKANNPKNAPSLRACKQHLEKDNALLLFPAGRVSYYQKDRGRIADHDWNRIVAKFAKIPNVQYCPVYIEGENSKLFYRLGRIWHRFRLLMLTRELTNKANSKVALHGQNTNELAKTLDKMSDLEGASFCRALTYLNHPKYIEPWAPTEATTFEPLAEQTPVNLILEEANALPLDNQLFTQGNLTAFFAQGAQIPNTLNEIARRRELVFRMHDEGSGKPLDTDKFDMTYTHLFVVDMTTGDVAGAYRMGLTDVLLKSGGNDALYLSQMFSFGSEFLNQTGPALEMGRSFLMPQYQKSRLGLFMLWRAIGEFVVRFPQYSTLYGTVSLSKLYDKRSIKLIEELAITPTPSVQAHNRFDFQLSPEVERHIKQFPIEPCNSIERLDAWLSFIEPDKKKLPVLLRQYASLSGKFHCLGVDKNFADTPGLLLSVDLTKSPEKRQKQFLGPNYKKIM